jgi:MFS family permease
MGTLSMLATLPGVLLGPIGGTLADMFSRKKIIVFSDLINGICVLSLVVLLFWQPENVSLIIVWLFVVTIVIGTVAAFFRPAVSASIPDLVPKEKLTGANSMNQSSLQISLFFGQGVGGVLFRILGAPVLFLIDGLTYLFSALSESLITIPQNIPEKGKNAKEIFRKFKSDTKEGFKYVWKDRGLRYLLITATFLNFFLAPIGVLLPFFVEDHLGATPDWFGFILASLGIGALVGYSIAGTLKLKGPTRGKLTIVYLFLNVLGFGLLGLATTPMVAMIMTFFLGIFSGMVNICIMTILQWTTPSEIRGRVFGVLGTIAGGLYPIGMGLSGVVADLTGRNIPPIYIGCGIISAVLTLLVSFSRDFRAYLSFEPKETANNQ